MDDSTNIPSKKCNGCLTTYPATLTYFQSDRSKRDSLSTLCKTCRKARKKPYQRKTPRYDVSDGYKRCPHCSEQKPATTNYFAANKGEARGLGSWCKTCMDAYRETHSKQYDQKTQAERKLYYQEHKEHTLAGTRKYYQNHKRRYTHWSRIRRDKQPDTYRAYVRNRRARKRAAPGTHTSRDIKQQYERQKGKCYYCGCKLTRYHVDHIIPLIRGGSNGPDNLVITCHTCNEKKGSKLPHEWPEGNRLL